MQAAPGAAVAAAVSVDAGAPRDWLGYQRYADALWARVVQNFELIGEATPAASDDSPSRRPPTGDPLVIGIYGEWGVGKSRLLELMYDQAARQNAEDCAQRARDPQAFEASPSLRLTVPVWFHPWKYEHEPYLAVPLLMHIAEAVQRTLDDAATLGTRAHAVLRALGEDSAEMKDRVEKAAGAFASAAGVAKKIAGNQLVKSTVALAAGHFGLGAVAERTLGWIEDTAGRFTSDEEGRAGNATKTKEAEPAPGWMQKVFGKSAKVVAEATPESSTDGRYYYNVHRYLSEITEITPKRAKRMLDTTIAHTIRLNIVVFVDDLDRCLPEKAVDMLEIIKTVLNVDSFAFVVALDDEVIERGISYRYRDYRFANAKPEMPITGFEYLEKIVHLPFRLPHLTRAQAVDFLRNKDEQLLVPIQGRAAAPPTAQSLWFVPDPATGLRQATPLVPLLLDCFDAYVPRKLGRAMELMHQFQQVFAGRGSPIPPVASTFSPTGTTADARMVLCCVLLQLFAPEIFRLLRRRPELFGHWMRAYLEQEAPLNPVFVWQKSAADQLMLLEVSDADLYRWVALGSRAGAPKQPPAPPPIGSATPIPPDEPAPPTGPQRDKWGDYLGAVKLSASDRYSVEQIRLPLATALSGFREMQRHAFAPLRLGGAMAFATGWTAGAVPRLQEYLNLFGDQMLAALAAAAAAASAAAPPPVPMPAPPVPLVPTSAGVVPPAAAAPQPPAPAAPSVPAALVPAAVSPVPRQVRTVRPGLLVELIQSPDASTRAALVDRLGLQRDEIIDTAAVIDLSAALARGAAPDKRRALEALASLAPYLEPDSVRAARHWPTFPAPIMPPPRGAPDQCIEICRPFATLALYGLDAPLGLSALLPPLAQTMRDIVDAADAVPLPLRSTAADLLGALGDRRFDFDPAPPHLPRRRALVQRGSDEPPSKATPADEPLAGFVRVVAGDYPAGPGASVAPDVRTARLVADVFIGRTLVTVQQYRAFVDDGGYRDDALWDANGVDWRQGHLDPALGSSPGRGATAQRLPAMRLLPWRWPEQLGTPTRPVVGVCWFEARAYAAWLGARLRSALDTAGLGGYRVRLPIEIEWERAARAKDMAHAEPREWPWPGALAGPLSNSASERANVDVTRLGHTSAVGLFPPNPLGAFDLAGNVWEWMDNMYLPLDSAGVQRIEFIGRPSHGVPNSVGVPPGMALRGGSWQHPLEQARCAARSDRQPWEHDDTIGLRVALVPELTAA